jgi:hypothetical protein
MRVMSARRLATAMATALIVLASARPLLGQGFYYKEIERDGRIYVFNNAARAAAFETSGEIGAGVTMPGSGPNGETVTGDSPRALQLFFFKHGLSVSVPEPAPPIQSVEWRDGKTRIATNLASLEISNRIQPRFTYEMPDAQSPPLTPGVFDPGEDRGSFRIRRGRFKLEGWFWIPPEVAPPKRVMPKLSYEVQVDWGAVASNVGAQPSNTGALLADAYMAWDPQGMGRFRVVFGQYKVPFGRQQPNSSANLQFVDRSNVSDEYERGRDIGVAIQGVVWSNRLEYRLGMFNGNGQNRLTNDNDRFQYDARLMWQPNGNQVLVQRPWVSGALYSEADFESMAVPLYALGISYERHDFTRTDTTPADNYQSDVVGVDGVYKFKGLSVTGEYFLRERKSEAGVEFGSNGGYIQGGMMLDQFRTWEAVLRYGQREVSDLVPNDDVTEIRGGINYYYRRHSLKFQTDFGDIRTGTGTMPGSRKDRDLRMQLTFIF